LNDIDNESTTSLEEKAEKLWRQAQEHHQKATEIVVTIFTTKLPDEESISENELSTFSANS